MNTKKRNVYLNGINKKPLDFSKGFYCIYFTSSY